MSSKECMMQMWAIGKRYYIKRKVYSSKMNHEIIFASWCNKVLKDENIQCAQNGKCCRKKVSELWKIAKKLSTSKNVEISKKMSYTPSYKHYPQKKG